MSWLVGNSIQHPLKRTIIMKLRQFITATLLGVPLGIGLSPVSAVAQQQGQQQYTERIDISFGGGSVESYVDELQNGFDALNVVMQPIARDVHLGAVKLKSASARDAVGAIEYMVDDPRVTKLVIRPYGDQDDGFAYAVLAAQSPKQRPWKPEVRIWALGPILGNTMQADDALSAVEAALDIQGTDATVKFHADTQLLMVFGSPPQLDAVNQVVMRLEDTIGAAQDKKQAPNDEFLEMRMRIANLIEQVSSLREENAHLREAISQKH